MSPRLLAEGLLGLTMLGVETRLRLRGRYWAWRMHTAFPDGTCSGGKSAMIRLAIEYGAWSWRTRRLR